MKKNSLTSAIIAGVAGVAGLAGVANAVNLNPDGVGQVLLYPYYTTNGGNTTLISVVNTADVVKAVKVRFLDSLNSKEVLDFNVYLSPHDVWTGAVALKPLGTGGSPTPTFTTQDKSCVAPLSVMTTPQPFRGYEFNTWKPDKLGLSAAGGDYALEGAVNNTRMRQGHIEVLEMGDLGGIPAANATHDDGVPVNCAYFTAQWETQAPTTWLGESGGRVDRPNPGKGLHDVYPPGSGYIDEVDDRLYFNNHGGAGGIYGGATIVNVSAGLAYTYNAEAINGFYTIGYDPAADGRDVRVTNVANDKNLHYAPGTTLPSLEQASNAYLAGTYYAVARIFDPEGTPVDVAFDKAIDSAGAVSAVLSARYVINDYAIVPGLVSSDWVITFPTKQLHTYRNPALSTTANGLAPFSVAQGAGGYIDGTGPFVGGNVFMGGWPESYTLEYWDNEEGVPLVPIQNTDVSPLPPPGTVSPLVLSAEANVLTFYPKGGAVEKVLAAPSQMIGDFSAGGSYTVGLEEAFKFGWARAGFSQSVTTTEYDINGETYPAVTITGLPVIGFWATKWVNAYVAEADGTMVKAYYNQIFRHKVSRDIVPAVSP